MLICLTTSASMDHLEAGTRAQEVREQAFSALARSGLGYLSSICFADVCRLDFLCATCVVTLSRSILWFCRTSSTCLHLRKETTQELRSDGSSHEQPAPRNPMVHCLSLRGQDYTLRETKALQSLSPSRGF